MNRRSALLFVSIVTCALFMSGCAASPSLVSIQVTPGSANIVNASGTVQFTAMGTYSHGKHPSETRDITAQVTWASSNTGTATISATGVATAVSNGTTSITATMDGANGLVTASSSLDVNINSAGTGGGVTPGTRDLTGISLIPTPATVVGSGNSVQFVALGTYTASPTTAEVTNVQWSSTNSSVATVDANSGLATAGNCLASSCATTITATATAPVSGSVIVGIGQLTVNSAPPTPTVRELTEITVLPGTQTINGSGSVAFQALGTYNLAPTTAPLSGLVWSSSNQGVAIDPSTAVATPSSSSPCPASCSTVIMAKDPATGIIGTAQLTFNPTPPAPDPTLTALNIIPGTPTLNATDSSGLPGKLQLIAVGTYNSSSGQTVNIASGLTWASSDTNIADIDGSGVVTARTCPTTSCITVISATNGNVAATTILTVVPTPPTQTQQGQLTNLTITPGIQNLDAPGENAQFIATGIFGTNPPVDLTHSPQLQWKSSDTGIANVDSQGVVTGLKQGTTTITATYTDTNNVTVSAGAVLSVGNGTVSVTPSLTITVVGTGAGTVASSPGGIVNCSKSGGTCTANFVLGATITLTATPNGGSSFKGWSSNCTPVSGNANQCTIAMGGNQSVGAIFDTP